MAQWNWLTKPETPYSWRFVRNVVVKGLALFVLANVVFALVNPLSLLGHLSAYNVVLPGRDRLPYGSNPDQSYNLSLMNLDAMFASHIIAGTPKAADEYRVFVIGDSSVWGVLLPPQATLSGWLNAAGYHTSSGKRVRVYNFGYPIQSLAKDLLILDYAMRYQPDLIVWMVTLDSFATGQQTASRLVLDNPDPMRNLINKYHLTSIRADDPAFTTPSFLDRTIIGQRRPLADLLRLQLYGSAWVVTQIDQRPLDFYAPHAEDLARDDKWQGLSPQPLTSDNLALDMLTAGVGVAGSTPMLIINEPIFASSGANSDVRYDSFYPRWAYDEYRALLKQQAHTQHWTYLDLWNTIPADQFTDSPVHLTPAGSHQLADQVGAAILQAALDHQ